MSDTSKEQRISIRFPSDVLAGLKDLARQHERSFNGEIIWALRTYLAQQKGKQRADQESL
ncbi:MAG TPA: Arc family DNA-binding protein [Ktedonobacterales bacterium]|nr:Arc family DNA-binding protein [Ktedonobacterales bacterium]